MGHGRGPGETGSAKPNGDAYNHRAIFVHQDPASYLDDMLYCAAVPAAVHWEGSTRFDSMIISDRAIRENGNLVGDYSEYLRKIEARPDIDFIGGVTPERRETLAGHFTNASGTNNVTAADNVYDGSCDIAEFYWGEERTVLTDTAVLAPVPESDGGVEVRKDSTGASRGRFDVNLDLSADEVAWLKYSIDWSDPQANTDYRIELRDPFVLHENTYSNYAYGGHVNPTKNRLYNDRGHCEIGVAPLYSYMPYSIDDSPQDYHYSTFELNLTPADQSLYPIPGVSDHKTFSFGPVKAGQWLAARTNWTYYKNNESDYRDSDTFIYRPGEGPGDEHLLEVAYNPGLPGNFLGTTPEVGYCYADRDGYYNVTVHLYNNSIGGNFTTTAYWGSLDETTTYTAGQVNHGTDDFSYHLEEYERTDESVIESVTNGAVAASLLSAPLLYTSGGQPEQRLVETLRELGVEKLVVMDAGGIIPYAAWEDAGFSLELLDDDRSIFNYIYNISREKNLHKGLVLNALGGPWFTGAALTGAYHGVPVPALDGPEMLHIQSQATVTWWQMIQQTDVYDYFPFNRLQAPGQANMEDLADDFFSWIEGFHTDLNPNCGDTDGDGSPENGRYWDYSGDVEVMVVSPLNALKPSLDRAINGKASVGRIPCADPSVLWAVVNREMLYWKVGFSRADNPENPDDEPPIEDHWNRAGWTFNTYAHDDGIMDNDAGDQDDDDLCGVDDGGINHLSYRGRDSWPTLAHEYGKTNEFHTYYSDIRDMLEGGTCYWSNNGHGHHYNMMETGIGATATGLDPSDPPFNGPVDSYSWSDPHLEITTGWDWFYGMDNVHSTFSTYQSCQIGGSALPEYFLRLGGIAVIGGTVTRSLVEATIQHDRTARGLFTGMTFGEAHRWGADETGCMYSLRDPGTNNKHYSELGLADDLWQRYGDTGQTILYGDPTLVMISPTLWTDVRWTYPESGDAITIHVTVRDQSGVEKIPDFLRVRMNGKTLGYTESATGIYEVRWTPEPDEEIFLLEVAVRKDGYVSAAGMEDMSREYLLTVPRVNVELCELTYTAGRAQSLDVSARINNTFPLEEPLTATDARYVKVRIYDEDDEFTGIEGELNCSEDIWSIRGLNVSSLRMGRYGVMIGVSPLDGLYREHRVGYISVAHSLFFNQPLLRFDRLSKRLSLSNLIINTSWSAHGNVEPSDLTNAYYGIIRIVSGDEVNETPPRHDLHYDPERGSFSIPELSLASFSPGNYGVTLVATGPDVGVAIDSSLFFSIDPALFISTPELEYLGGMSQRLIVRNVTVSASANPSDSVHVGNITQNSYAVYSEDGIDQDVTGDLDMEEGSWRAEIDVCDLEDGSYYLELEFSDSILGSATLRSDGFNVTHVLEAGVPVVRYNGERRSITISELMVRVSHGGNRVVDGSMADVHRLRLFHDGGSYTGILQELYCSNDNWTAEISVADLPFGSYFVSCDFVYDDLIVVVNSSVFLLDFALHVNMPEVRFDRAGDTLEVYGLRPYSDTNTIGHLNRHSATLKSVYILNETGGVVLQGELLYEDGEFHIVFDRMRGRDIEGGTYRARVTFATVHNAPVSNTSEPFSMTFPDDDTVPGDDEPGESAGTMWIIAGIVGLLILMLAFIIFALSRRGSRTAENDFALMEEVDVGELPFPERPVREITLSRVDEDEGGVERYDVRQDDASDEEAE